MNFDKILLLFKKNHSNDKQFRVWLELLKSISLILSNETLRSSKVDRIPSFVVMNRHHVVRPHPFMYGQMVVCNAYKKRPLVMQTTSYIYIYTAYFFSQVFFCDDWIKHCWPGPAWPAYVDAWPSFIKRGIPSSPMSPALFKHVMPHYCLGKVFRLLAHLFN